MVDTVNLQSPVRLKAVICCLLVSALQVSIAIGATGDLSVERKALGSTILIKTSARFGGAVESIVFRGKQYVDTRDHGRELQSASSFDGYGECFNPTEAGSAADYDSQISSSRVIDARAGKNWLETKTDMAFWLSTGFDYKKPCGAGVRQSSAVNKGVRGGYVLSKRLIVGEANVPNLIADHVTFTVPDSHSKGTFEAATLYTSTDFLRRYVLNMIDGTMETTTIFGEQQYPVILATADGSNAIGVFSPGLPQQGRGYGSFSFPNTEKINCVFREENISAGAKFRYACYFAIGTLDEVRATILSLPKMLEHKNRD